MTNNNNRNPNRCRDEVTCNNNQDENKNRVEFGTEIDVNQIKNRNRNNKTQRTNNNLDPRDNRF
jgi:hypothetical protein